METFTIKSIFPRLDLPDDEIQHHRIMAGRGVKMSFKSRFTIPYTKVPEDGFEVICYPIEFKSAAETVIKRYVRNHNLPIKQRKRVLKQAEKVC